MTDKPEDLLPVTQADRDAAMQLLNHAFRNEPIDGVSGECFDDIAAAFARHRQQAPTDEAAQDELKNQVRFLVDCAVNGDNPAIITRSILAALRQQSTPRPIPGPQAVEGERIDAICDEAVRLAEEHGSGNLLWQAAYHACMATRAALSLSIPGQSDAVERAARIAEARATEWGERWKAEYKDKPRTGYDNGRLAGLSDGAAAVAREIRAAIAALSSSTTVAVEEQDG